MIRKLSLENFRNYKKTEVEINSDLVLVLGNNAAGKTNLIESLYYLSNLKSFRTSDNFLVKSGEDYFKVAGAFDGHKAEAVVQINPVVRRGYKIDDQKLRRLNWNTFRTVLFEPSDLEMFVLGPGSRRKYLNQTLSQKSKVYAADLASLDHVLKQKSALLGEIQKGTADVSGLDFWNEQLADAGLRLSKTRREYLDYIQNKFENIYRSITGFGSQFRIVYKGAESNLNTNEYLNLINSYRDAEVRSGQNLIGPHRDDFTITKDGYLNTDNSSRGELRSQTLTIKLIQAEYLSEDDKRPVILLDDVFSELDEVRRTRLIESLKDHQIFITSTEEHHLPKLSSSAQIIRVDNGQIK